MVHKGGGGSEMYTCFMDDPSSFFQKNYKSPRKNGLAELVIDTLFCSSKYYVQWIGNCFHRWILVRRFFIFKDFFGYVFTTGVENYPANFKANWLEGRAKIPTEKALASITLWGGLFFSLLLLVLGGQRGGGGGGNPVP